MNARNMESNLRFDFVQLDQEVTNSAKDNYTGIDEDLITECSSAENSIHKAAPSESSVQQRTRPRTGKLPVEEAMIEIARKKT
jgi:hypothetical protein